MKNFALLALALMLTIGFTPKQSEASNKGGPLWVCQLGFKGEARGLKILIGSYKFNGAGTLRCVSVTGNTRVYPVWLTMNAKMLSPGIALGKYTMWGQAAEISLFNCDPDELLGKYMIAQAHATLFGGVGAITAVRLGNPQLALNLSLQVQRGWGFDVTINQMRITPRNGGGYDDVDPNSVGLN